MPKPLSADLPFPDLSSLKPDAKSARIIAPAYASAASELTACLQYIYHRHFFEGEFKKYGDLLEDIAVAEMRHLDCLGKGLKKLGFNPVYAYPLPSGKYYSAAQVDYSSGRAAMLLSDITAETEAIQSYEDMLTLLKNDAVSALISRILLDERMHLKALNGAYSELIAGNSGK